VLSRGRYCVFWHYELPLAVSISGLVSDDIAAFSAAGNRDNFHKILLTVLTAGRIDGISALSGFAGPGSSLPQPNG
jgi:hypothetical protein